jgi:hypothetical protein
VTANHGHVTTTINAIATTHGYTDAFRVAAFIALTGFLISLAVVRVPPGAATAAFGDEAALSGADLL